MNCEICDIMPQGDCNHEKNGYCAKFLIQAALDAKEVNMHKSKYKKAKDETR
jgi:hypothetical protein